MEIRITSTDLIAHMEGVPMRVWEGVTAGGVPCKVFVHRIAVERDADCSAFERELYEQQPPSELRVVPLRQVL